MLLAALGGATLAGPQASEKCRISNVFADHMVLQRAPQAAVVAGFAPQGTVITTTVVWGTARPPPHLPRLPTPSLDQPTSADHTHTHRHTPSPLAPLPPGMPHRYAPPPHTINHITLATPCRFSSTGKYYSMAWLLRGSVTRGTAWERDGVSSRLTAATVAPSPRPPHITHIPPSHC